MNNDGQDITNEIKPYLEDFDESPAERIKRAVKLYKLLKQKSDDGFDIFFEKKNEDGTLNRTLIII